MLNTIKGYFFKLIEPVVGRKRKNEESNESPPNKQMKLDNTSMFKRDESLPFFKTSKEHVNVVEDDECVVLNTPKKKWELTPPMARRALRTSCEIDPHDLKHSKDVSSMLFGSLNHKDRLSSIQDRSSTIHDRSSAVQTNGDKDLEIDTCVKNNSFRTKYNVPTKQDSSIRNKIFRLPSSNNKNDNNNRPRGAFPNVKKFLNESYRFQERHNYLKLIKSQSKLPDIFSIQKLGFNSKQPIKSSIPVVDLTKERSTVIIDRSRESVPRNSFAQTIDISSDDSSASDKKIIPRVNSLGKVLSKNPVLDDNFVPKILNDHERKSEELWRQVERETKTVEILNAHNNKAFNDDLEKKMQRFMRITDIALDETQVEEEQYFLPELTDEQNHKVDKALAPAPAGQILVENFGLQIKRRDIQTLKGLNWLNDEVINFYMNLIMERGKNENMPKVYAFNTFFYPKLLSSGHSSLKRWTKKVDIFSHDMVLVPVHLGMHWCMSVMDFRNKQVRYYDSMGAENDRCLQALLSYLEAESLDKRKTTYDTSDWEQINVDDIPQQMNGSDCGVFSCMFAEHLARDSPILFTQEHMPYFRRKMILEILETKLLT